MSPRKIFWLVSAACFATVFMFGAMWRPAYWGFAVVVPLFLVGLRDLAQRGHALMRNFPVVGHGRYWMEELRPPLQQYFVESETSGRPFSRELRSLIYQRAKKDVDTRPFGTVNDLYEVGAEWMPHSLAPVHVEDERPRLLVGEGRCAKAYSASLLNVSAMSFGSLSANAIRALNGGALLGNFYHNTGEGGVSPYHLEAGGDLTWQLGTGYFSARTPDGDFDPARFEEKAKGIESIRMIEVKLSQGAKPSHGGILPAKKLTEEIAEIRGVPMGRDVLSPPAHTAFDSPRGLLEFVAKLRDLSGGKPVGFKLCVGRRDQFLGVCKAMLETGLVPDFITVDGAEGGTGAAPLEFSNSVGMPLTEGLLFVRNALVGCSLKRQIRIIASGKIVTGFDMAKRMALGADMCNAARPMMFALGCIQALKCNTNKCPVGVATQDPDLVAGLDPDDKATRVFNYHRNSLKSFVELLGAAGLRNSREIMPRHVLRRCAQTDVKPFSQVYEFLEEGALLGSTVPASFAEDWAAASAERF